MKPSFLYGAQVPPYCVAKGTTNPASTGGGLFAYRHNKQTNDFLVDGHVAGVPFGTLAVNRPSVRRTRRHSEGVDDDPPAKK